MDQQHVDAAKQFQRQVGERLRAERNKAGLSLQAAADHLDLSRAAIGHWETGVNPIDIGKLHQLARLYGTTVVALVADKLSHEDFIALTARQLRELSPAAEAEIPSRPRKVAGQAK